MNPIIVAVFIATSTATSYRSVPNQTDSSPFFTSIGERVNGSGIAVHPQLLCPIAKVNKGKTFKLCKRETGCPKTEAIHYYDVLYVEDVGFKVVNDVMASKTKMNSKFDIWVPRYEDEQIFHAKYKSRKLHIWRIKSVLKEK